MTDTATTDIVINGVAFPPVELHGERVVTLSMIDKVHGRPDGTARRNFNVNKDRLVLGKHYHLKNQADEIRSLGLSRPQGGVPDKVTLLTERGYLMLVKSFTDDLAWQVQDMLVERYFRPAPDLSGMVKDVITQTFAAIMPELITSAVAQHRFEMVEGLTATDVIELAGYGVGKRPRGTTQLVTARSTEAHNLRGVPVRRTRRGRGGVRLFDESAARAWLAADGQRAIDHYVTERAAQGKLALRGKLVTGTQGKPK